MNLLLIGGGNKKPFIEHTLSEETEAKNVLIIPSACSVETSFIRKVDALKNMLGSMGVQVNLLHEFGKVPTKTQSEQLLGESSMVYIVGGNTPTLLRKFVAYKEQFDDYISSDRVVAGTSAGALVLFKEAMICPVVDHTRAGWEFEVVPALGYIDMAATAHANKIEPTKDQSRLDAFVKIDFQSEVGVAIDNSAAIRVKDGSFKALTSVDSARVKLIRKTMGSPKIEEYVGGDFIDI